MYQRIGPPAYNASLDKTLALCELMGNPHRCFESIHIAGTNGKGSVSHMLASVLQQAGYKTGLYTSPHLKDFRERIRINGKMISKKYVTDFVKRYKLPFEQIKPSFFEMTVAMAYTYFAEKKCDVVVVETGLGGRLDSTNIIIPVLSIVTNISYDHTALLGNTLAKIASEKAGIIKSGIPVVIGEKEQETKSVFIRHAHKKKAELFFAEELFDIENCKQKNTGKKLMLEVKYSNKRQSKKIFNVNSDLSGLYQSKNIRTVLSALKILNDKNILAISDKDIQQGLSQVSVTTGLKGRWQVLSRKPLTIADTGHNEAGIREILNQLKRIKYKQLHFVFGAVNDKDISTIIKLLPPKATYYFCKARIDRALDATTLKIAAQKSGKMGEQYSSVKAALKEAKKNAKKDDLILIGGSTFVVAEAI